MSRLKRIFLTVFIVLIFLGALWAKDSIWAEEIPPTRLGLANSDPIVAKTVKHAFELMSERLRAAYPQGARSSIYKDAPPFDAAAWLDNYATAGLVGDLPRLSNLHARLQQAALVLSRHDLLSLTATLVKAASLASREIEDDRTSLRQFTGYLFMAFIPVFDHTKRVDETLQAWLLDNRHLAGDLPSLFLRKGGRVVYYPLRGEDCPLCSYDPKLTVDSFIGLAVDTFGGVTIPLLGDKTCAFSEMLHKGFDSKLGPICQRNRCMPSKDPKLNPDARVRKDPHPVSSLFGGGDGEDCEEAEGSSEEGCGIDLPAASGKDQFFACNFGAIVGMKNERWNYMNTDGALPCIDPRSEGGGGTTTTPTDPECEDDKTKCDTGDGSSTVVWDSNGDGTISEDEAYDVLEPAWEKGVAIWDDVNLQKALCAFVCERWGITFEHIPKAVNRLRNGGVFFDTKDKDPDPYLSIYAETQMNDYNSQTGGTDFRVRFYYEEMDNANVNPVEVAGHETGHAVMRFLLLAGPMAGEILQSTDDDSLYEYEEYVLGLLGFDSSIQMTFDRVHDRGRQCTPDDPDCGNSCSALTQFVNEIGSCLETAFGHGRPDPGLAPWIQPVPDEVAMSDGCNKPMDAKNCNALRCEDGSAKSPCSWGKGCCCNKPLVDVDPLPHNEPLPGCPDGVDPLKMCLPEI